MKTRAHELEPGWHANVSALLSLELTQQGRWLAHLQVLEDVVCLRLVGMLHMELSFDSAEDEIVIDVLSLSIENRRVRPSEIAYHYRSFDDVEYCVIEIQGTGCFARFVCASYEAFMA